MRVIKGKHPVVNEGTSHCVAMKQTCLCKNKIKIWHTTSIQFMVCMGVISMIFLEPGSSETDIFWKTSP